MDAKEEVKARLSIEDVIGEYVELKRAGRNLKALSPFSAEKTPSFMVSPEKQIWHDFSSGKGGDMFSFVMEVEGLDFREALELLARKAGVDLSQYRRGGSGQSAKRKERLYAAHELAVKFYQVNFSKHQGALEYIFKKRQFSKEVALDFQLGYAPNTGSALVTFLRSKQFADKELKEAGLATERYGRLQDMFRGRIMIPLHDPQGRTIGFTARLLEDNPNAPKYLNTPQTLIYDKGRHVYGLHLAKEAIRRKDRAVIVEGNLDVIASHQAGVRETVATAGTAMTDMHLKALSRFTTDIRLAFDRDSAGINATERAIPLAAKAGVNISIIDIPEGKDPDELIKKNPKDWEQAIESRQDVLDWLIVQYEKRADLTTQAGREQFKQVVLASVKRLESAGEQGVYARKVAQILGYDEEAIKDELRLMKEGKRTYKIVQPKGKRPEAAAVEYKKLQDHLLGLALMHTELRGQLESLTDDMLQEPAARQLLLILTANPDTGFTAPDTVAAVAQAAQGALTHGTLSELEDYVRILLLQYEELYQGLEFLELQYEATRMQARLIERYVKTKKTELAEALRSADEATTARLLEKAKAYDTLLHKYKGGAHGG